RRRAVLRRVSGRLHGGHDERRPPDAADAADSVAVRQALAQLPEQYRAVLVLRFYADCSVKDVAATLDIPEGTVKTLTSRGISRLRAAGLSELEDPDAD